MMRCDHNRVQLQTQLPRRTLLAYFDDSHWFLFQQHLHSKLDRPLSTLNLASSLTSQTQFHDYKYSASSHKCSASHARVGRRRIGRFETTPIGRTASRDQVARASSLRETLHRNISRQNNNRVFCSPARFLVVVFCLWSSVQTEASFLVSFRFQSQLTTTLSDATLKMRLP